MADEAQQLIFVIRHDDWPKYVNQMSKYFGYRAVDFDNVDNPESAEQFVVRMLSEWMADIVDSGEKQDATNALDIPPIVIGIGA